MLSESAIRKLEPRPAAYRVMDGGELRGFGVRVTPAGDKAYFLRYSVAGKTHWHPLGHWPHTPLSAARQKARTVLSRLDQGLPLVDVPVPSASLESLLSAWLEHQQANDRRRLSDVERMIRVNLPPAILAMPAKEVTSEHIRAALAAVHHRGARVMANRLRARLHALFQYGLKADHDPRRLSDPVLFGITVNPVSAIPRDAGAESARDRVLAWDEIRAVWHSDDLGWLARQGVRLLLTTGQRVNEVCQAAWAEFDMQAAVWTLPAARSKNHFAHMIPLSPLALELLSELREVYPGDWLFPARNAPGAARCWGNTALAHAVLRWQAGVIAAWRPQDLRRTVKTHAVAAGIGRDILDKVQNHARQDVASRHYDRHDYLTEKRAALDLWADILSDRSTAQNHRPSPA